VEYWRRVARRKKLSAAIFAISSRRKMMKRTTLAMAALCLAFSGCHTAGTWKPNLLGKFKSCLHGAHNLGAPCDAGCEAGAPGADGCQTCGESAGYGSYGETVIGSYETPVSSGISDGSGGISIGSPITSGSSAPSGTTILQGSTLPSASPNPIRSETIRPKPAN